MCVFWQVNCMKSTCSWRKFCRVILSSSHITLDRYLTLASYSEISNSLTIAHHGIIDCLAPLIKGPLSEIQPWATPETCTSCMLLWNQSSMNGSRLRMTNTFAFMWFFITTYDDRWILLSITNNKDVNPLMPTVAVWVQLLILCATGLSRHL